MNDQSKRVVVNIDPLGNVKLDAQNFAGVGCQAATDAIEKSLGTGKGGMTRVLKGEFYEAEPAANQEHAQQW